MSNEMMSWLPVARDFSKLLRDATQCSDDKKRFETLVFLAQHRLDFLETVRLDRVLCETTSNPLDLPRVRVSILTSVTVDHLLPAIRVGCLRRGFLAELHKGGYGQYRQELLDRGSDLYKFNPQIILFSLTATDLISAIPLTAGAAEVEAELDLLINDLRALWRKARDELKATIIQQTFLNVAAPLFGSFDRLVPGAPAQLTARLNSKLAEAAAAEGVLLLDIARASERGGIDNWFDAARWLQGKLEVAPNAAPIYGDLFARVLAATRGAAKKCLVLDLDNTLWSGVIGDDGLKGIVLGEGSAVGEAHLALQRYAKQLKERGIILAVCSKNEMSIAEAVFHDHPEMHLKRSDIAAFYANWNDKVENLKAMASSLNIGIDSLVFVDDNPVERARVRESLPMVAVPELPGDAAYYVRCLADAGYFEAVAFTADDRTRADQYAANAEREALLKDSGNLDDFLSKLGMTAKIERFSAIDLARVTQLINKTNQFNPTTRRVTSEEVSDFAASPHVVTLQCRLLDKFGDNGIVSAMILVPNAQDSDMLEIACWVMSCRVFGRQLESEIMNLAVDAARKRGAKAFRAEFIPTPKNAFVRDLYPGLGFSQLNGDQPSEGATRWYVNLLDYKRKNTHITTETSI